MSTVVQAVRIVFPKVDPAEIEDHVLLSDIEGWDSMNSINLQMELETMFDVDLSDIVLHGNLTVGALAALVAERK